ncbi:rab-GTPase-TBC domain-containing protein [Cyathus striatus]|nr:rab-GTPase-TBC domain-containing protein [Cyathus striatus]
MSTPNNLFQAQNTSVSTININQVHSTSRSSSSSIREDSLATSFSQISINTVDLDTHREGAPGIIESEAAEAALDAYANSLPSDAYIVNAEVDRTSPSEDNSTHSTPPSTPSASTSHVISPNLTPSSYIQEVVSKSSTIPVINPVVASSAEPQKPFKHRPTRSTGPSMFEKVRSKTRPSFLPPKPRAEDDKHMADWQHMMKLSRAAAEKRRKALQDRRIAREKAIEDSLHVWEKEIVPDWRIVDRNHELRKLWWRGIPTKLRPILWERVVGNDLALSKDHYKSCLARAKRALASGVFPQKALDLIEEDVSTTLPALHIFHRETGPLYADLKDMLYAWVVARSDEGLGYTLGAARIAAMVLINMPNQQGFIVMRNLLERHLLRSFFGGERSKEDVEAYYRIFDTLLADCMPKIYFNFKQHQVSPAAYLPDWLIPLFLDHLPFEACARIWDVVLLEGDSFLYRASLGILGVLEPRLFFPEKKELLELLRGENKAAIEVAKREGRPLDGGKYEIYGVDEETLWGCIDSMNDWWKESTWTRLIQRELPDL